MKTSLVTRSLPSSQTPSETVETCTLEWTQDMAEKPLSIYDPPRYHKEMEPVGPRTGHLTATILNPQFTPDALMGRPSVFQWPGAMVLLLVNVNRLDVEMCVDGLVRYHTEAEVLRAVQYGEQAKLTEGDAKRRLLTGEA